MRAISCTEVARSTPADLPDCCSTCASTELSIRARKEQGRHQIAHTLRVALLKSERAEERHRRAAVAHGRLSPFGRRAIPIDVAAARQRSRKLHVRSGRNDTSSGPLQRKAEADDNRRRPMSGNLLCASSSSACACSAST